MLGVLAGLLYATLLSAYDAYYNEFGLEPDDVGLSYLEVLARAPVPLLYTLVLFAYALLVGAIIAFVVTLLVRAILQRLGEKHRQAVDRYFSRVRPVAVLGFATFAVGLTFFVGIRGEARSTGFMAAIYGDAVDAVEVEPEFPLLPTRMTMLEVKALPARLVFTRQGALTGLGDEGCLLYLGTANGVHALYDVSGRHALHVPASLVSVVTDRSEEAELPDRCNHIEEAR